VVAALLCALAVGAPGAAAQIITPPGGGGPEPKPYRADDFGGFRDVLPPGTNGLVNGPQLAAFLATGARPQHNDDQLRMYADLVHAAPGLQPQDLERFFKDSSFGVKPEDVERRYSPREDVTIVRDRGYGVPHIYGETREGAMFGTGYATAEDRLFFLDVFRHLGRAQLSSFVGGAPSNRALDADQWRNAPYREEDLQRQIDRRPPQFAAEAELLRRDLDNYVAGINAYIREARLNPLKMPGEYAAIGRPQGPDDWQGTDVVATASVIGGIFGRGGGGEFESALVLQQARERFGRRRGRRVWNDFRSAEDPEAPTTVRGRRFPYQRQPKRPRGTSIPDPGSVRLLNQGGGGPSGSSGRAVAGDAESPGLGLAFPDTASNALLVSAAESESGRPLAVFGPQTGYFSPEVLMEQEVHAPDLDARGASFPGVNLYVSLGRGRDYAWSATSAGKDIIDTFALDLCEPGGGAPTIDSMHYSFRGECRPIDVLERTNSWEPTPADQTPAGSETLRAERTALGIGTARATVRGKPVIYTRLRSTYFHETDSGLGLSYFNTPSKLQNAQDFQRAANLIGYTFNWFYADDRDIAYFNSGFNPARARRVNQSLPVEGRYEWRDFEPNELTARYQPARRHPQALNQRWLTSWNNKQARGTRAADAQWGYGSVYRSQPLDERIRRGTRGPAKMSLTELVDAMEDAGTVDLRADKVLPLALKVLGSRQRNPAIRDAISMLRAWRRDGAHRRDRDDDGAYEHADAIRIMDAWWPLWIQSQFRPTLGRALYEEIQEVIELDNSPNNHGQHLGSAYQNGWYGYAHKDLRAVLGRRVRGRYSRKYCGGGSRRDCRLQLASSLKRALTADFDSLYRDSRCDDRSGPAKQRCYDSIYFTPLGGVTQPLIHWINRPTYQQVVEVQGHRPR
jgi:acyl-homoserine lactone acylase PvdQ